jgi:hypothetical protein
MSHRILATLGAFAFSLATAACIVGEPIDEEIDEAEAVGHESQSLEEVGQPAEEISVGKACKCRKSCISQCQSCISDAGGNALQVEACVTQRRDCFAACGLCRKNKRTISATF